MYPIKQSTAITVPFFVHDVNGDPVTGLTDGSFTKRISKNGAAFGAMTVVITELELGWYSIPLSTAHSDTLGILSITFTNAGAKQVNLQFRIHTRLPDDLAFPTTPGTNLESVSISVGTIATDAVNASALATDAVNEIRDAIHPVANTTLSDIPFVFKDVNDNYVTGATGIVITRSIDGGAFGAVSGTTVGEIGNGLYQIDASAADMNGGKITFRITATGGLPAAPVDRFVTIVTNTGN